MKKGVLLSLLVAIVLAGTASAQAPDTLVVPPSMNGEVLGVLENTIMGDTTATGDRANLNRVYKLQRGAIYFLNGPIRTNGYPLHIIADEDDPADPTVPPVIAAGIREDGSNTGQLMRAEGDVTLKNLYIVEITPTGAQPWSMMQVRKDSVTVIVDNCNFELSGGLSLHVRAQWTKVFITNTHYRNAMNQSNPYNGRALEFSGNPVDTLVMMNNTLFNSNSFFFQIRTNIVNFARIEHNTLVNTVKWPIQWSWQTNAIVSNNIFYNVHSYGEAPSDLPGQDFDGDVFGIINIDTLTTDF